MIHLAYPTQRLTMTPSGLDVTTGELSAHKGSAGIPQRAAQRCAPGTGHPTGEPVSHSARPHLRRQGTPGPWGTAFADEAKKAVTPRAALLVIGVHKPTTRHLPAPAPDDNSSGYHPHNRLRRNEAPTYSTVTYMPYDAHTCSHPSV
ncbi:hypothetical protein GCM10018966_042800 [Streptomyces yanii]